MSLNPTELLNAEDNTPATAKPLSAALQPTENDPAKALDDAARHIRDHLAAISKLEQTAKQHALAAGLYLLKVQALVKKSQFETFDGFLEREDVQVSRPSAFRYMSDARTMLHAVMKKRGDLGDNPLAAELAQVEWKETDHNTRRLAEAFPAHLLVQTEFTQLLEEATGQMTLTEWRIKQKILRDNERPAPTKKQAQERGRKAAKTRHANTFDATARARRATALWYGRPDAAEPEYDSTLARIERALEGKDGDIWRDWHDMPRDRLERINGSLLDLQRKIAAHLKTLR